MGLINKQQEYHDQEAWSKDIQKLKGYKELVEKVEYWTKQTNIFGFICIRDQYEIVFDNELGWCVDVDGDVSFSGLDIEEIPFQFRNIGSSFSCFSCQKLTSLKGCPIYIDTGFSCGDCNKLTSLEYCPKEVGGDFYCYGCGKQFTREYVRSLCNVKGKVFNGTNQ